MTVMITIKIKTGNSAFQDGQFGLEVARILRELANDFADEIGRDKGLYDYNGNRVGGVVITAATRGLRRPLVKGGPAW